MSQSLSLPRTTRRMQLHDPIDFVSNEPAIARPLPLAPPLPPRVAPAMEATGSQRLRLSRPHVMPSGGTAANRRSCLPVARSIRLPARRPDRWFYRTEGRLQPRRCASPSPVAA